ncbi:hypothetical protein [Bdellovibrio sp. HCB2-146]
MRDPKPGLLPVNGTCSGTLLLKDEHVSQPAKQQLKDKLNGSK